MLLINQLMTEAMQVNHCWYVSFMSTTGNQCARSTTMESMRFDSAALRLAAVIHSEQIQSVSVLSAVTHSEQVQSFSVLSVVTHDGQRS